MPFACFFLGRIPPPQALRLVMHVDALRLRHSASTPLARGVRGLANIPFPASRVS